MGVADVSGGPQAREIIDKQYEDAAQKIKAVQDAFDNGTQLTLQITTTKKYSPI